MKQAIDSNIWMETEKGGQVHIGFTNELLNSVVREAFHVIPANNHRVREKGALMTIETMDGLKTLLSPVAGKIVFFNPDARDTPDMLTDSTVIISVNPNAGSSAKAKKAIVWGVPGHIIGDNVFPEVVQNVWMENDQELRRAVLRLHQGAQQEEVAE